MGDRVIQEDRSLTHEIGEIAHQFLYQAIINGSATGVDNVVAVFTDNLRAGTLSPKLEATWTDIADVPLI